MLELKQLLGFDESDLIVVEQSMLHRECVPSWQLLHETAAKAGFEVRIASAYRSFDRQLKIWNEKAQGSRPVLDQNERVVDVQHLSGLEIVNAILRWSALPGASRHHWGSEIDIYENSLLPSGYSVRLTLDETCGDGVLAPFYSWLNSQFAVGEFCGFSRPYFQNDACGVASEPWHLSCITVASRCENLLDRDRLYEFYQNCEGLLLRDEVLRSFDAIYERFIKVAR